MPILREGARSVYPYLRKGKQSLRRCVPLSGWGKVRIWLRGIGMSVF